MQVALLVGAVLAVVVGGVQSWAVAQDDRPRPAVFGDPPNASLITISEPDENGLVTIRGDIGAVFPGAVVAIRNMYTGETAYPRAEITGAFVGQVHGEGNTPYWISPAARIETIERDVPGALPGGPGVVMYGPFPERNLHLPALPAPARSPRTETRLTLDGDASDWPEEEAVTESVGVGPGIDVLVSGLMNADSIYLAVRPAAADTQLPEEYKTLELGFEVGGRRFMVTLDPRRGTGGQLYAATPGGGLAWRGPVAGYSVQGTGESAAIELRIPRTAFTGQAGPVALTIVRFTAGDTCLTLTDGFWNANVFMMLPELDTLDPPVPPMSDLDLADGVSFTLAGPVGGGTGTWSAVGRINQMRFAVGDTLILDLRVTMTAPEMPGDGAGLALGADLWLEPVTVAGVQQVADRATGNGWSGLLTPTGLPIENVSGRVALGNVTARHLVIEGDTLTATLQWRVALDEALPAGLYTPAMAGYAILPGIISGWEEAGVLGGAEQEAGIPHTRLPLVLQIGEQSESHRLLWTLFQDQPASSGARGIVAEEDAGLMAVSGHVAHSGGVYVLPGRDPQSGEPIPYPLEPYLPAMLSNSLYQTLPPLVPLAFDSGELRVKVTLPDGTVDDLGTAPLVQNQLSTAARLESVALGADSPLDTYRLTTLDPRFTAYTFSQDGHHRIEMTGTIRDIWGNTYTGGGTYDVWIAEPLQMLPGTLPGTPFEVGDVYNPALTILPGFPAEVTVSLWFAPLNGDPPVRYTLEGRANAHGYFHPGREAESWRFDVPGEYLVDITAQYTDGLGRLWMGNVRGAGVVASQEAQLVAHGARGLANAPLEDHLAWYAKDRAAPNVNDRYPQARAQWPYNRGDILWVRDQEDRIHAALRLADREGTYEAWLVQHLAAWQGRDGVNIQELANQDELPLVPLGAAGCGVGPALTPESVTNTAYAYLSAVRSGVTVRQMVLGDETPGILQTGWDGDDPHNYQRGMGQNGDLPGDYAFLFGGAVVHNTALDLHEAVIYGATLIMEDVDSPVGTRVYPPLRGAANGPDGGPMLATAGGPGEMFFVSTGFQPGQVFTVGDTLALAGQIAPTLPGVVRADVYTPGGRILPLGGRANAVGYYYDSSQNLVLNEPGIWRIRLQVSYDGLTSAGAVVPPAPSGGVPGAEDRDIFIYVLPEGAGVVELDNIRLADAKLPIALPFNLVAAVPFEWDDVVMHYSVTMNGHVLDSGVQPAYGDVFAYNFDPRRLNRDFPNLDIAFQNTQTPYSVDAIRITFVLQAVDENGELVMAGRTVTLFGDRLLTLYDGWPEAEGAGQ
ncbi:MAG: hypothetical protein Kow0077_09160 [Anaerolineae bacterium]